MQFLRPNRRTYVLVASAFAALVLSSCSMKDAGESKVVLNIPSTSSLSSRVGAFTYAWDRACFAMNVTARDIQSADPVTCEPERGVFAGTAAPNTSLTAQVTRGSARKLELYVYFRNSSAETCPVLTDRFGTLDRKKIFLVGKVDSFDVVGEVVNLSVDVSLPASASASLASSMPASCVATAVVNTAAGRVVAGAIDVVSPNGFKVRHRVSNKPDESPVTSANGFKLKGSLNMDVQ